MGIQASESSILEIAEGMKKTSNRLKELSTATNSIRNKTKDWDDSLGLEFAEVLRKIAKLIEKPSYELDVAVPKLRELAALVQQLNHIHF